MRQPEHLEKILKAVKKSVSIPLTLKIRSGWSATSRNAIEITKIAEGAGCSMLAIHGRTRQDLYRGLADWDIVSEVCKSVSIPVVGSGDIVDAASAKMAFESGVNGLMIGRGAMANPWIFSEIASEFRGVEYSRPSNLETVRLLETYLQLLQSHFHEKAIMGRLKQLASQVTRRVHGATPVRKSLCMSKTVGEFVDILGQWRIELESGSMSHLSDSPHNAEEIDRISC